MAGDFIIDLNTTPLEQPEDGVIAEYSNVVNLDWTLHDVRIRFAQLIQVPNDESPTWKNQHGVLDERVIVTMPWPQAKHLRNMLSALVKSYEDLNGEIKPVKLPHVD